MLTTFTKVILYSSFLLVGLVGWAQAQGPLDTYIQEGLSSNLVLREKQLGLQRGLLGLKNAKQLFLPSVNFNGSYTLAAGGRKIDFPIGDLLNPVYSTLNQLTQSNSFPQVENQNITFLPNNFYDVKVRTTVPILNSDIIHNKHLQEQNMEMQDAEVEVYKLELVKNIRQAYYQYLMALESKGIYQSALQLVEQNLRVSKSLLDNGKGLPAQVLRAESEVESVKAQITQADANVLNAGAYLNFLVNRPANEPIKADPMDLPADLQQQVTDESRISRRPELVQLDAALKMNDEALKMDKQYWVPSIGAFVDLGSQGFNFEFSDNTAFILGGISVDLPIWNGGRDQTTISLREQSARELENKVAQAQQGFALGIYMRRNATLAALESWKSALRQVEAAEAYYRLMDKAFAQGTASMIEQIDARNTVTQARLLANIRKYETLIGWAEYRREIAEAYQ